MGCTLWKSIPKGCGRNYLGHFFPGLDPLEQYDRGLSTYLAIDLLIYFSLSVFLFIDLSIYLSICGSICLRIYFFVFASICLSTHLSNYLSICQSVHLSLCLPVYLSIHLSFYLLVENEAILRDFLTFLNLKHQKRSNPARRPERLKLKTSKRS